MKSIAPVPTITVKESIRVNNKRGKLWKLVMRALVGYRIGLELQCFKLTPDNKINKTWPHSICFNSNFWIWVGQNALILPNSLIRENKCKHMLLTNICD